MLEGFVIVVSVLLAFGIDTAWDESRESAEFAALLELLQADMDRNLAELHSNVAFIDENAPKLQTLLAVIDGLIPRPEGDSLRVLLDATLSAVNFTPTKAAYDAASGISVWERIPAETQVQIAAFLSRSANPEALSFVLDQFPRLVGVFGKYGGLQAFASDPVLSGMGIVRPSEEANFDGLLADQAFENELLMYLVG